jgi:hypothetical protein
MENRKTDPRAGVNGAGASDDGISGQLNRFDFRRNRSGWKAPNTIRLPLKNEEARP